VVGQWRGIKTTSATVSDSFGLGNVAAIHELPLHIVTEAFSTIDVFKKTKQSIRGVQ